MVLNVHNVQKTQIPFSISLTFVQLLAIAVVAPVGRNDLAEYLSELSPARRIACCKIPLTVVASMATRGDFKLRKTAFEPAARYCAVLSMYFFRVITGSNFGFVWGGILTSNPSR